MSNERDELTDLIRENRTRWATNTEHHEMEVKQADAIIAAGYRKPREITTAEELDALPELTVIRAVSDQTKHFGTIFEKYGVERPRWLALDPSDRNDGEETVESGHVLRWFGSHSVTVLYTPEAKA